MKPINDSQYFIMYHPLYKEIYKGDYASYSDALFMISSKMKDQLNPNDL